MKRLGGCHAEELTEQPAAETRRNHGQHGKFPRSQVPVREPPSAMATCPAPSGRVMMPTPLVVPIRVVSALWATSVPVGSSPFRRILPTDREKSPNKTSNSLAS